MCVYLGFGLLILPGFSGKFLRLNIKSDSFRDSFARPDLTKGTAGLASSDRRLTLYPKRVSVEMNGGTKIVGPSTNSNLRFERERDSTIFVNLVLAVRIYQSCVLLL